MSPPTVKHFGISPKKRGRGKAQASLDLIEAAYEIAERLRPMTVRGICYKLFAAGVIPSMAKKETKRVSRLLVDAREEGTIPWEWIVDEKRRVEKVATFRTPETFVEAVKYQYRKDAWEHQPHRVRLVSEKGTVRGVVRPVLDEYGVGFLSLSGYSGATTVHDLAQDDDGRPLILLYIGDWDPSGLCMSHRDLPTRLKRYGGHQIELHRIALLHRDLDGLPSFPASTKKKDSRYKWFTETYGRECWELDAMDENALRRRVKTYIEELIDADPWERCLEAQEAEHESLSALLDSWTVGGGA